MAYFLSRQVHSSAKYPNEKYQQCALPHSLTPVGGRKKWKEVLGVRGLLLLEVVSALESFHLPSLCFRCAPDVRRQLCLLFGLSEKAAFLTLGSSPSPKPSVPAGFSNGRWSPCQNHKCSGVYHPFLLSFVGLLICSSTCMYWAQCERPFWRHGDRKNIISGLQERSVEVTSI